MISAVNISDPSVAYLADNAAIICADTLETEAVKDGAIDLIVTSPPYNLGIKYDSMDDSMPLEEYMDFSKRWMGRAFGWLREDGRMCVNVAIDAAKGTRHFLASTLYGCAISKGFKYYGSVLWDKRHIKQSNAFGSWLSASAPCISQPVELIMIFYKSGWKKHSGSRINDITKDEFVSWVRGIWTVNGESAKRIGHPAPFPTEIPKRCIKLLSFKGDTVLDPFAGSGSTIEAAILNGRKAIGIELSENYTSMAIQRAQKAADSLQTYRNVSPS